MVQSQERDPNRFARNCPALRIEGPNNNRSCDSRLTNRQYVPIRRQCVAVLSRHQPAHGVALVTVYMYETTGNMRMTVPQRGLT
jgi:hypothetical protein